MNHNLLVCVLVLADLSLFGGDDSHFVFLETHLQSLKTIADTSIAPNGKIIDGRPAIQIFAERNSIPESDLALAIVTFAKLHDDKSEYPLTAEALGHLGDINAPIAIPYLKKYILDERHKGNLLQPIYAYRRNEPYRFEEILLPLLRNDFLSKRERLYLYKGIADDLQVQCDVRPPSSDEAQSSLVHFLSQALSVEKDKNCIAFLVNTLDACNGNTSAASSSDPEIKDLEVQTAITRNTQQVPQKSLYDGVPDCTSASVKHGPNESTSLARPLAISAIATALLGIAGFLWRRRKR